MLPKRRCLRQCSSIPPSVCTHHRRSTWVFRRRMRYTAESVTSSRVVVPLQISTPWSPTGAPVRAKRCARSTPKLWQRRAKPDVGGTQAVNRITLSFLMVVGGVFLSHGADWLEATDPPAGREIVETVSLGAGV